MPAYRTSRRSCLILLSLFTAGIMLCGNSHATPPKVAFLSIAPSQQDLLPHNRAAWECARTLGDATLLLLNSDGTFSDTTKTVRSLNDFDVVWYHQGDAIRRTAIYRGAAAASIKQFAQDGGGVLLSGGSLAMVAFLGLEGQVRAQRRELENFRDPAFLVPEERNHPIFRDLQQHDGAIGISHGGCTAIADFYWGGPAEGMVLANTPKGVERPLVEYRLGKGRVIVFGWRWPDYADETNPYRANLLKLSNNLIHYLATPGTWQPVVIRSAYPPVAFPEHPGIAPSRWRALRMAIEDLSRKFPREYSQAAAYLEELNRLQHDHDQLPTVSSAETYLPVIARFEALQREALLANPLLDFDHLLFIRRQAHALGMPLNFYGNADIPPTGYQNSLQRLSLPLADIPPETVYEPGGDRFIGDLDLHYDAGKLLCSIPDQNGRWQVAELALDTATLTPLPLIDEPDVHNYDACYLPDERIVFTSTAPFVGVPCVGGRSKVGNLYLRELDGAIHRLTNDQDHNWCPTVLNNGRILYQRWEYADIAHAFTRLLFHANPDGSRQMEYYGSNSYWPTAMFYARPIPNHPTKFAAIVTGHHGVARQGELVIFDPALGRQEASGVVQRIPGHGKPVEPVIIDSLVDHSWPRFLHPYPLSDTYFIVACKPTKHALWGLYLVDTFDNFVLLHEEPGWAMLEPLPLRNTPRQPIIADTVDRSKTEATIFLTDIYQGPGLKGVPKGAVKSLRLVGYDFTFHELGAEPDRVGLDGPWDVKRILGTVPVEADGSASFTVPANTPIALQPLDNDGKALALMRSWMTAAPGETLSCVGCHEQQNSTGPFASTPLAARRAPSPIQDWYGPARGFSFEREVQPVLDAYCTGCHNGNEQDHGTALSDLTAKPPQRVPSAFQMHFSPAYMELRRWVHTPTLESDAHLLPARAFHADTSKLIQLLRDDHYGVRLNREAWERLITWIDLNAPYHGTWKEVVAANPTKHAAALHGAQRRRTLNRHYAGFDKDPEAIYPPAVLPAVAPLPIQAPEPDPVHTQQVAEQPKNPVVTVAVTPDISLELVHVPAGSFVMGANQGYPNERPAHLETVAAPFLIGRTEITNELYRSFDPTHDSGLETGEAYQFGDDERGFPLNRPQQPVVRVSWDQAMAFCDWLSGTTGMKFTLPTEIQWEYACRAGSATPLSYGGLDDDFSPYANLSDATHYSVYYPHVPTALPPWRPADTRFDDGWRIAAHVGSYTPNPWGLYDMHGNVAEWTLSPYGRYGENMKSATRKVVRGGSWLDRPVRARAAFRLHFEASQAIHDVGFRVVCALQQDQPDRLALKTVP